MWPSSSNYWIMVIHWMLTCQRYPNSNRLERIYKCWCPQTDGPFATVVNSHGSKSAMDGKLFTRTFKTKKNRAWLVLECCCSTSRDSIEVCKPIHLLQQTVTCNKSAILITSYMLGHPKQRKTKLDLFWTLSQPRDQLLPILTYRFSKARKSILMPSVMIAGSWLVWCLNVGPILWIMLICIVPFVL